MFDCNKEGPSPKRLHDLFDIRKSLFSLLQNATMSDVHCTLVTEFSKNNLSASDLRHWDIVLLVCA